jgi:adenylate cyclase
VQEDILTNLSKIAELLVIGRTSTLGYRDTTKKLKDIGAELGVRYLLEGSVRRAGNEVRVRVTLIDSNSEAPIWTEDYERSLTDTFAIQAEIAQNVAEKLRAELSPAEIKKIEYRPTRNQEAYDYYVQYRNILEVEEGDVPTLVKTRGGIVIG